MMEVKLFDNYQDYLAQLPSTVTEDVSSKVSEILEEVRNHGDSALKKLTYRFDGIELDSIQVQPEDLQISSPGVGSRIAQGFGTSCRKYKNIPSTSENGKPAGIQ